MERYFLSITLFLGAISIHMFHSVLIKKIGLQGVISTYEIIFMRSLITFLILAPFFATKKLKFIEKKNIFPNLIVALCSIIATYCWHYGLSMVPVNNAITINYLTPMLIPLIAVLILKDKVPKTLIFSIIGCFATIIIFYKPKIVFQFGYLILFVDVLLYSTSIVLSKKLMLEKQSPISLVFFKVLIICLTSIHIIPTLIPKIQHNQTIILSTFIVSICYMTEFLLSLTAYSLVKVSKLQPLYYTRIVFGASISYFILGEQVQQNQIIVAIIIVLIKLNLIRLEAKNRRKIQNKK